MASYCILSVASDASKKRAVALLWHQVMILHGKTNSRIKDFSIFGGGPDSCDAF
jgi:hypothetical protein